VQVGSFECDLSGGRMALSARLRSRLGERRFSIDIPLGAAGSIDDVSFAAPIALFPAMLAGEDLHIDGTVDPSVLRGTSAAADIFGTWDRMLRPARVTAATTDEPEAAASGVGSFFSRGVDSMFDAALADRADAPLTHLVFVDGIEPRHSDGVRAGEIDLAREAASLLGLDLVLVRSDLRDLTDDRRDWGDVHGCALAGIGLALGGMFGRVVIPSTDSVASLVPYGSHPAVDGRFSTNATTIEHGDTRVGRLGKVVAIVRDRPDLLPFVKVCFQEDRTDNCGRCGKCLLTMCCLQAAGALDRATGFPDTIDLDAIRAMRPAPFQSRIHWVEVARGLGTSGRDSALRDAILDSLRRSARPTLATRARLTLDWARGRRGSPASLWRDPERGFDAIFNNEVLSLLTSGRPARALRPVAELPEPPPLRARMPDASTPRP
jgi:hypothetical protein